MLEGLLQIKQSAAFPNAMLATVTLDRNDMDFADVSLLAQRLDV